jgi:hypothetical protein
MVRGQFARAISLQRTSYATVCQSFSEKQAGAWDKLWFATDTPASSVFVPFYANVSGSSPSYRVGHMAEYDDRSAWWVFDFVANWMDLNHRLMTIDVSAKIAKLQDLIDEQRKPMEAAASQLLTGGHTEQALERLSDFQARLQERIVDSWRKFGHFLIMKYNDGRVNYPTIAGDIGYPAWWLQTFNVNSDILTKWGQPAAAPPTLFEMYGPGPFENVSFPVDLAYSAENGVSVPFELARAGGLWAVAAQYLAIFAVGWLAGTRGSSLWRSCSWTRTTRAPWAALATTGRCDDFSGSYVAVPSA